jgi:H+/Cl- antiporter ClcA
MAVEDDADRPTSLIYHSVTNAAIVATVQVVLWSAFLASLTWYFDTSPGQYISPVVIGIVAGAAGAYMNPNPPTMGP